MTTEATESQRLRDIHRAADDYAARITNFGPTYEKFCLTCSPNVWWTRAEIEAWPGQKKLMIATLLERPSAAYAQCDGCHGADMKWLPQDDKEHGRYMTREMLPATVTPAPVEGGKLAAFFVGQRVWFSVLNATVKDLPNHDGKIRIKGDDGCLYLCKPSDLEPPRDQPAPKPTEAIKADPYAAERAGPYGGSDLGHEQVVAALTLRDAKVKVLRGRDGA